MAKEDLSQLISSIEKLSNAMQSAGEGFKAGLGQGMLGTAKKGAAFGVGAKVGGEAVSQLKSAISLLASGFTEMAVSLKREIEDILTQDLTYKHTKPFVEAQKMGEKMAAAGVPVDREYIKQMHDHYRGINLRKLEWRKATQQRAGMVPGTGKIQGAVSNLTDRLLGIFKGQRAEYSAQNVKANGE